MLLLEYIEFINTIESLLTDQRYSQLDFTLGYMYVFQRKVKTIFCNF